MNFIEMVEAALIEAGFNDIRVNDTPEALYIDLDAYAPTDGDALFIEVTDDKAHVIFARIRSQKNDYAGEYTSDVKKVIADLRAVISKNEDAGRDEKS